MEEKTYVFEVSLKVVVEIPAISEFEARKGLTEAVADYFAGTTKEIDDSEAVLLETTV
jgi:hypothetical protein